MLIDETDQNVSHRQKKPQPYSQAYSPRFTQILRYAGFSSLVAFVVIANLVLFKLIDDQLSLSNDVDTDVSLHQIIQSEGDLISFSISLSKLVVHQQAVTQSGALLQKDWQVLQASFARLNDSLSKLADHENSASMRAKYNQIGAVPITQTQPWQQFYQPDGLYERSKTLLSNAFIPGSSELLSLLQNMQETLLPFKDILEKSFQDVLRLQQLEQESFRTSLQIIASMSLGLLGVKTALILVLYVQSLAREKHRKELANVVYNLRTTIESSLDAAVIFDYQGRLIDCNHAGAELFSWDENSSTVRYFSDVVRDIPSGVQGIEAVLHACANPSSDTDGRTILTGYKVDGTKYPVEVSLARAQSATGSPMTIAFMRDISDLVEREETLRQARNAAQEGEKAKSRFLAMMSHEMRTPLNGLLSAVELLLSSNKLTSRQVSLVDVIEDCGRKTLEQVNNMLDLTRLGRSGEQSVPKTTFSLSRLVFEVAEQFRPLAQKNGNNIICKTPQSIPAVLGQRPLIERILINLVSNAVKFTKDGQISIMLDASPARHHKSLAIRISVTDTGVGIAEADLERIFNAFETIDYSYTRIQEGSGLGLGLAKLAANSMGGHISVTSQPQSGSTFSLFLTLQEAEENLIELKDELTADDAAVEIEKKKTLSQLSLLVVEDNTVNRELLVELLRLRGYLVDAASNGAEGVDKALAHSYDAILMDIAMPVMDGLEATRRIRQSGASKNAPIIAITANADISQHESFGSAGMNEILSKPVDMYALEKALLRSLRHKSLPAQLTSAQLTSTQAEKNQHTAQHDPLHLTNGDKENHQSDSHDLNHDAPSADAKKTTDAEENHKADAFINLEILSEIESSLGKEYIGRVLERFFTEAQEALTHIDAAVLAGDLKAASQVAHKAAGGGAAVGLTKLNRLFAQYEMKARDGDMREAQNIRKMIDPALLATLGVLQENGFIARSLRASHQ